MMTYLRIRYPTYLFYLIRLFMSMGIQKSYSENNKIIQETKNSRRTIL